MFSILCENKTQLKVSFQHDDQITTKVAFGNIRLLRQKLFKGERLVPPLSSVYTAVALPWGCDTHSKSAIPAAGEHVSLCTPSELVTWTVERLFLPFDLYVRARWGSVTQAESPTKGGNAAVDSAQNGAQQDPIIDQYGLWCTSYEFLIDTQRRVSYLRIDFATEELMRLMASFVSTVQFSDLGTSDTIATYDNYHQRRFVLFPIFEPTTEIHCDNSSDASVDSFYDLPPCVVCLDRLDENISGLRGGRAGGQESVLCAVASYIPPVAEASATRRRAKEPTHSDGVNATQGIDAEAKYCTCVTNSSCTVCQLFVNFVRRSPDAHFRRIVCVDCGIDDDLYQCLICGHIGCSRYRSQHSLKHYLRTAAITQQRVGTPTSATMSNQLFQASPGDPSVSPHFFSISLASQEIWDYGSDTFANRLVTRIPAGAPGAIKQFVGSRGATVAGAEQLLANRSNHSTLDKATKGNNNDNVIDEFLGHSDTDADEKSLNKKPKKPKGASLGDCASNDNVALDDTTDVTSLKYDAKVEQLCTEYSSLLSQQMADHRQSFLERMRPMLELRAESDKAAVLRQRRSKEDNIETEDSEIDLLLGAHQQAAALYMSTLSSLTTVMATNIEVQVEEQAIQKLIDCEKSELKTLMASQLDEMKEKDCSIANLRESIAEMEMNLATKNAIARQGGASAMAVMGSVTSGRGRGRGAGRR